MAKYAHDAIVPDKTSGSGKKEQVAAMFDDIAPRYDFLNRFLSAGIDVGWRKKAIGYLKEIAPQKILDVATGTADVALLTNKILKPAHITGIDISEGMLQLGRKKITAARAENKITLISGDSAALPFDTNSFDAVTVAFGVRNFEKLELGLQEILRVLRPGGKLVVLEFSKPSAPVMKQLYNFYMRFITPNIGRAFSKNATAYKYLDESITKFPERQQFTNILAGLGYINIIYKPLSLGICSIYCGTK